MEGLYSASLGAMASLLRKLDELARIEDKASGLRDDLRNISTKLAKASKVDDPSLTMNYWMKDVRELSYDMEDCIDQFVLIDDSGAKAAWMDNLLGLKTRVEEVRERYDRYRLEYSHSHPTGIGSHRFRTLYSEPRPVISVGMKSPTNELRQLVEPQRDGDSDLQLKVVSILGAEGVGKSTLAQELRRQIEEQFECRAFVQTARKPDMRMILRSILSQIQQQQPPEAHKVPNLIHDIRKHLQDKRYFIIIDGIWTVSVWDILSRSFPENNHRSRIVTTTTIEDVALACCGYDPEHIFSMKPLGAEHSNQLFISRVFGTGKGCPQRFNDVSDDITRKCGGLPLAIICIASLLASQPETVKQWEFVHNFLDHNLGTNSSFAVVLKQVLKLWYNSLPHCFKTCLLYISVYPENYLFLKHDLVRQWIAEDFVCPAEGKDIVEVTRSYFDELLSLGLIQQMDTDSNKKELSYVVHPAVFDFITRKSMEDNFITIIDYSQSTAVLTEKVRRLSLHFGSATYATAPASVELSQVRSLTFMGLLGSMPPIAQFKLVRVVILHICSDDGDARFSLSEICELLLLRYFQVRSNVSVELPDQMQCLKYLETLEIDARVETVPTDIVRISSLLHVCLGEKRNHKHLTLYPVASRNSICSDDTSSVPFAPTFLQRFELPPPICIFSRLPEWIRQLGELRILEIVVGELWPNDIAVLAELPALTALSLYVRASTAGPILFNGGAFPSLVYFKFMCDKLLLEFQEESMPNLRRFKVGFNAQSLQNSHILVGIQHLLNLQEVAASIRASTGAEDSDRSAAEFVLLDTIGRHPYLRSFKVKWIDQFDGQYDSSEKENRAQEIEMSNEKDEILKKHETRKEDFSEMEPWEDTSDGQHQTQGLDHGSPLLLLLATFVATVTYQGLNPSVSLGQWQYMYKLEGLFFTEPRAEPEPLFCKHKPEDLILTTTRPRAFFYCNSVTSVASLVAIILLQKGVLLEHQALEATMILDLFGLMGAYSVGSCWWAVSTSISYVMALACVLLHLVIHVFLMMIPKDIDGRGNKVNLRKVKDALMQKRRMWLLFAILATVTFQVGLRATKGFWPIDDELLARHHAAHEPVFLYIYWNTLSFMLSIVLVILLINPNLKRPTIIGKALPVFTFAVMSSIMGAYAARKTHHLDTYTQTVALVAVVMCSIFFLVFSSWEDKSANNMRTADVVDKRKPGEPTSAEKNRTGYVENDMKSDPTAPESEDGNGKKWHAKRKYLMLLGVLMACVTYDASLAQLGVVWQGHKSGQAAGNPILCAYLKPWYLTFFYANSISFVASMIIIALLLMQTLHDNKWLLRLVNTMIVLDLMALLVAYVTVSYGRSLEKMKMGVI